MKKLLNCLNFLGNGALRVIDVFWAGMSFVASGPRRHPMQKPAHTQESSGPNTAMLRRSNLSLSLMGLSCGLLLSATDAQAALGVYQFGNETDVPTVTGGTFTPFARQNVTQSLQTGAFRSSGWNTGGSVDINEYVQ